MNRFARLGCIALLGLGSCATAPIASQNSAAQPPKVEPAPYATMLSYEAAVECEGLPNGGSVSRCTNGFLNGNYFSEIQMSPPSPQSVSILVAGAPDTASWVLSNPEVAVLTKTEPRGARIKFAKDGDAELLVQNAGRVLLRVRLFARTFKDRWAVHTYRTTEKGEMIGLEGYVGEAAGF